MKLLASLVFVAAAVAGGESGAAELKMFTSRALSTVLGVIGQQFEQTSGHKLNVIVGFSSEFAPRINSGEAFDLMMSPPPIIDGYITAPESPGLGLDPDWAALEKSALMIV